MRLDHFIAKKLSISERAAKTEIASGRVCLDGKVVSDHTSPIDQFRELICSGEIIQEAIPRLYVMLNKPVGYLSATSDPTHPTVLDLIGLPYKETLHLAGRLDRSSTGLVLLTNDSVWSKRLSHSDSKVEKVYLVETVTPIPPEAVKHFENGFHFEYEGIITRPAKLEILSPCQARVTLSEGKYHQIKRMFFRLNETRLTSLHREKIGEIELPDDLPIGEWRHLPRP